MIENVTVSADVLGAHFGRMLHNITPVVNNTVPHESRPEAKLRQEVASQVIDNK